MKTYSVKEIARMMNVCDKTVRNWDSAGYLVANKTPSGRRYYTEEHIRKLEELKCKEARNERFA